MRGQDSRSGSLFSYVDLEQRVRSDHPLRTIRTLVNEALAALDGRFGEIYSEIGRPSIPPEQLLRAMLLQAFYSVRSERQLMERLDFDLLFRWFVGLGIDDAVWDASTFSKNRDRLLEGCVAAAFLCAVLAIPRVKRLLSQDHFSVDGTLIQAWASMKSFNPPLATPSTSGRRSLWLLSPKDGTPPEPPEPPSSGRNAEVDFHGKRLSNDTHQSTTDLEARLYRKGKGREARLSFMGGAGQGPYVDGPRLQGSRCGFLDAIACVHMSGLSGAVAHDRWPRWCPRCEVRTRQRRRYAGGPYGVPRVLDRSIHHLLLLLQASGTGQVLAGASMTRARPARSR